LHFPAQFEYLIVVRKLAYIDRVQTFAVRHKSGNAHARELQLLLHRRAEAESLSPPPSKPERAS
jgi:hypothetical protein